MELETDLERIRHLANKRERENWTFRAFLKTSGISSARIDARVHELCREISSHIDCTQCANCCKVVGPLLGPSDVKRLAAALALPVKEFRSEYLEVDPGDGRERFKRESCPLLKENRCTAYEHRPHDCRSFPHLHKREFVSRLSQAVSNCSFCPIVFNVYEELKREFWRR
ncbi:MAG: YkgJ family cysteine cluster protein [Deltaproteobacteria bacterium]|nr:YkgJ family cysteine cluster protein [Deltaproteobacteria bacterium]